jgi:hypothetical protein
MSNVAIMGFANATAAGQYLLNHGHSVETAISNDALDTLMVTHPIIANAVVYSSIAILGTLVIGAFVLMGILFYDINR